VIPTVGQHWSQNGSYIGGPRLTFRIEAITGSEVAITYAGNRSGTVRLQTLKQGHRGARLERHADGTAAATVFRCPPERPIETRTASEVRKVVAPRGGFSPRALQVGRLAADGKSTKEIAEMLGIAVTTVARYRNEANAVRTGT
jgi:DNA-binding CsgD family transcriptional regulator